MKSKGVTERDLSNSLRLLGTNRYEIDNGPDLKKICQKAFKRWHPDVAIGSKLGQRQIDRYTVVFQKLPSCLEVLYEYLENGVRADTDSNSGDSDRAGIWDDIADEELKTQQEKEEYEKFKRNIEWLLRINAVDSNHLLVSRAFRKAFFRKDRRFLRFLAKFGVDVNKVGYYWNPLTSAIVDDDLKMVRFLLGLGADPNTGNIWLTLFEALIGKNKKIIEILMDAGARFENIWKEGGMKGDWNLLMELVTNYDLPMVELFVARGTPIDVRTRNGATPLMAAVEQNKTDVAAYLLKNGANPDLHDRKKLNAYKIAMQNNNRKMAELIRSYLKKPDKTAKTRRDDRQQDQIAPQPEK